MIIQSAVVAIMGLIILMPIPAVSAQAQAETTRNITTFIHFSEEAIIQDNDGGDLTPNFIPFQYKLLLFLINSITCLLLQFFIIRYVQSSVRVDRQQRRLVTKPDYIISLISLCILGALIG